MIISIQPFCEEVFSLKSKQSVGLKLMTILINFIMKLQAFTTMLLFEKSTQFGDTRGTAITRYY